MLRHSEAVEPVAKQREIEFKLSESTMTSCCRSGLVQTILPEKRNIERIIGAVFPDCNCDKCGQIMKFACGACRFVFPCQKFYLENIVSHLQQHKFTIFAYAGRLSTYLPYEQIYFEIDGILHRIPQLLALDPIAFDVIRRKETWSNFNIRQLTLFNGPGLWVREGEEDIFRILANHMIETCECICNLCGHEYESFPPIDLMLSHLKVCDRSTWERKYYWEMKSNLTLEYECSDHRR